MLPWIKRRWLAWGGWWLAVGGHPVMLVHHVTSCRMKMNKSKLQEIMLQTRRTRIPVRRLSRLPSWLLGLAISSLCSWFYHRLDVWCPKNFYWSTCSFCESSPVPSPSPLFAHSHSNFVAAGKLLKSSSLLYTYTHTFGQYMIWRRK